MIIKSPTYKDLLETIGLVCSMGHNAEITIQIKGGHIVSYVAESPRQRRTKFSMLAPKRSKKK